MLYYIFQHRASFGQQLIGDIYYFVAKMDEKEVLYESIQNPKSYAKMKLNGIGGGIGDIRNIIISGDLLNRKRINLYKYLIKIE